MVTASANETLPPGARVHWYTVTGVLGQGGFGITYAATDGNLHRPVALKEFFPASFARRDGDGRVRPSYEREDETFRWGLQRFLDEARTLARFDHPNVVRVLSVFEENGTAYMAMEYLQGDTLAQALRDRSLASERTLLPITHALLSGLEHIHAASVVHRDIKPENVLLREDLEPVLLDFGSAREALQHSSLLTAVVTRGYAPFEQYGGSAGDVRQGPWTDIYGLAASLYHVVTLGAPVDAMSRGTAMLEGRPDPLVPAVECAEGDWSQRFLAAIDAALAFSADARPRSAGEWREMFPPAPGGRSTGASRPARSASATASRSAPQETVATEPRSRSTESVDVLEGAALDLDVLVVDDEAFVLNLTRRVLSRLGMRRIRTASGGREALARLDARGAPPDVIICDLNMPDLDGVELMRHLGVRRAECGVILLSGMDKGLLKAAESLAQSHGLYLLGSLEKPAKPAELRRLIESFGKTRVSRQQGPRTVPITEEELLEGLAAGAVEPVYQPKVQVADRALVGVEALARWRHPLRGVLGPAAFVPLAEETGHMGALTEAVLRKALAAGADWLADGLDLQLSVNLSADSLRELELPARVVALAESQGFAPGKVILEVTETRVMEDLVSATEILTRLRLRGVGLAVDDFGTGFSSLEQLRRAPFTELKIDRAFVHGAAREPELRAILESSVALGKRLRMTMVAEGVEDEDDWEAVAAAGCHQVQGYFVARPMGPHLVPAWAEQWSGGM